MLVLPWRHLYHVSMKLRFPPLDQRVISCGCGSRPVGQTTGWRQLPGVLIECAVQGTWKLSTEGGVLSCRSGQAMMVPSGVRHQLVSEGVESAWTILVWNWFGRDPLAEIGTPQIFEFGADLSQAIHAMVAAEKDPGGIRAAVIQNYQAQQIFVRILDHLGWQEPPPPNRARQRLQELLAFIDAHLDERLTRSGLARYIGISPTRLHDVFRAATKMAPMEYIGQRRTERAAELLLATNLSIAEIGQRVGFADPHHFSRVFRSVQGESPRQYRQRHGER